jgi:TonB family protein
MKFLCRFLLLCLIGLNSSFAQNTPAVITASSCGKPEYPSVSKRLEEEGVVQIKFLVGTDGKVIESAVEKSSGFSRLDEAAKEGLSKCQFKPATVDGKPQQSWASLKYTYRRETTSTPSAPANLCKGDDVSKFDKCLAGIKYQNGERYVGYFIKGRHHGKGTLTLPNGDKYSGEFVEDKFHGLGTFTWSTSGNIFTGNFQKR